MKLADIGKRKFTVPRQRRAIGVSFGCHGGAALGPTTCETDTIAII